MGIDIRDPDQPVGTLSGGERQSVAIARAVHFGARVLILDEPTSALGVKQAGVVLRRVAQARERGLGVVFITHNPHHAHPVGDRFVVLNRGRLLGDFAKDEISPRRTGAVDVRRGGAGTCLDMSLSGYRRLTSRSLRSRCRSESLPDHVQAGNARGRDRAGNPTPASSGAG